MQSRVPLGPGKFHVVILVYDNANAQTSSKSKIRIFYFTSKKKLFYLLI